MVAKLTPADCQKLQAFPAENPVTGRKIDPTGALAKKLLKECEFVALTPDDCLRWKADPM